MDVKAGKQAQKALALSQGLDKPEAISLPTAMLVGDYLLRAGFLAYDHLKDVDPQVWQDAIKAFQRFFGFKKNGVLGQQEMRVMVMPRCGVPDVLDPTNPAHQQYLGLQARAAQQVPKWRKSGVTYTIRSRVKGMSAGEFDAVIAGAFNAWDKVCGIAVSKAVQASKADIVIDTGRGRQSDFDGPSGVLAWAFLPQGDDVPLLMKFDLDEAWTLTPQQRGILLFNVACHEFGHNLGLTHSTRSGALMAPTYNAAVAVPQLDDDIPRMISRYGQPEAKDPGKPPEVPQPGEYTVHVKGELTIDGHRLLAV